MNNKILLPQENPPHCGLHNCRCVYQRNTVQATLAIYCENRKFAEDMPANFCAYMASCGSLVWTVIEVLPTDKFRDTIEKAVKKLMPALIANVYERSKARSTVWH